MGPESVDLSNLIILSMRWSADGQTLALATGGDPANAYHLVLVSPARGEARYVLSAQGDPVAVSSSLFGWTN